MFVVARLIALVALIPRAIAWGAAGHEIVATIAQIHLHPAVRAKLCTILPPEAQCHLAPVAAWADQVRGRYPGTGSMHYINAKQDHPADHCSFGEDGWMNEDINVMTAIMNMTQQVMDGRGDIPLRFLVHFIGDLHQPLHLSGRDRGGNGAMFRFEGRARNLHSVWDSGIITKNIRELQNYTSPLPSKQIESNLLGAIFDPYVRFIVWEGIREWWKQDLVSWLECPLTGDPYPHSSTHSIPASSSIYANSARTAAGWVLSLLPEYLADGIRGISPIPLDQYTNFNAKLLSSTPPALASAAIEAGPVPTPNMTFPACPYTWAKPLHEFNCDIIWPKEYTGEHGVPLIELDTDEYLGEIKRRKMMEKLLAMAGLRLAKVVNEVLGFRGQGGLYFEY